METIRCSNCKRDILPANFVIHEIHCQRNIYLCSKCNEPVNHNLKNEHDKANHVPVFCTCCHAQMEKYLLCEHLRNNCPHRKMKCQICDIEVSATHISEHEDYCGARTEKCLECGEYIMLKYRQLHIDSNHTFIKLSDEPGPSPSWQNRRRTLGNFLPDLESLGRRPQSHPKKKSGRHESNRRRAKGSPDYIEKWDETRKENWDREEGKSWKKTERIMRDRDESKGSVPDRMTDFVTKMQTSKQSISDVAESHRVYSTDANSEEVLNKDAKSPVRKGSGKEKIPGIGCSFSKTASAEASDIDDRKNNFSDEIYNDEIIAQAIEENAAVLSEFSLFDPIEKSKSLTGKNLSRNVYSGNVDKTVTKARLYDADDSSEDEFLLYSKQPENERDYASLPCQFCGSLYPSFILMSHQKKCDLYGDFGLGRDDKKSLLTCRYVLD